MLYRYNINRKVRTAMITDRQAKILSLLEAQTDFMTLIELGEKLNFSKKRLEQIFNL